MSWLKTFVERLLERRTLSTEGVRGLGGREALEKLRAAPGKPFADLMLPEVVEEMLRVNVRPKVGVVDVHGRKSPLLPE